MMRSGRVSAFEEAKAQFQRSWEAWKAWAKLEEAPLRHAGRTLDQFSSRGKPEPYLCISTNSMRGFRKISS